MQRSTFIALLIPLLMLTAAMAYRYFSNDSIGQSASMDTGSFYINGITRKEALTMVHEQIARLKELGIDATLIEDQIAESISACPAEIIEAMDASQLNGMLLTNINWLLYEENSSAPSEEPRHFFCFDVECMDLDTMYTTFVNRVAEIAGDDLIFTEIVEDTGNVDYESGTGTQTISFCCNGKPYRYDATVYNDWFDVRMLDFMNDVISEQSQDKHLYVTSDGYQECIVFCCTKDWVARLKEATGIVLEQPKIPPLAYR